jgi:hypothetical protein
MKSLMGFLFVYVVVEFVVVTYIVGVNWGTDYSAWRSWGSTVMCGMQVGLGVMIFLLAATALLKLNKNG